MISKTVTIQEVSVEELVEKISNSLLNKLEPHFKKLIKENYSNDNLLSRKEVGKYLNISLVTVHLWSKEGILKPYKLGTRIYFKEKEILKRLEDSRR